MKKFLVALVLSVATLMILPASVGAGSPWVYSPSGWVPMRYCASPNCPVSSWQKSNTKFYMICYLDTQWADGNYWSNRWFQGIGANGDWDWIHSSYVYYQISVRQC
jgi:hypothetical protein